MLTKNQENYLKKIPETQIVSIKPFDNNIKETAEGLMEEIAKIVPNLEVLFMGAAALGIAGQNDLDLYILCPEKDFEKHLPMLEERFGEKVQGISIIKWEFIRDAFPVELYLTDPETQPMREQIKLFEILKKNQDFRNEYERIKQNSDGLPLREYMRRKYEFFNRILK